MGIVNAPRDNAPSGSHSAAHPLIVMAGLRVRFSLPRSTLTDLPDCHP